LKPEQTQNGDLQRSAAFPHSFLSFFNFQPGFEKVVDGSHFTGHRKTE
jgi:hypothetical protein